MQRVVLVTGPKGGLGTFVTGEFLNAGYLVAGVSKSVQPGDFAHERFRAFPADLSSAEAAAEAAGSVAREFGRIDVLAHIAGGFAGGRPVHQTSDAEWAHMFAVNLFAANNVLRAVIPHMRAAGAGRIVAIAGRAALEPASNIGAYAASKASLVSLVRTVALENKDCGITANTILPGTMDTPGNRAADPGADRSQWVRPGQVAALVLFLASEAAAGITGAAVPFYGLQA